MAFKLYCARARFLVSTVFGTAVLALSLVGCAGRLVQLKSVPGGAEVAAHNGEVLGVTPLTLSGDQLEKATQGNYLNVVLNKNGHLSRELYLEIHGEDQYELKLQPLDTAYFEGKILKEYSQNWSVIARELLQIQGNLFVRKTQEAEKQINDFIKKYPGVAAAYVMGASLALKRGDQVTARRYLESAQGIDPKDPVVTRMLGSNPGPQRLPATELESKP